MSDEPKRLSPDELDEIAGETLPARELMSLINPDHGIVLGPEDLGGPVDSPEEPSEQTGYSTPPPRH